jgi:DNA mismatch repair protein MutS
MQQYVDMKSENPDALLMFRLGDFYESFFDDARTISSALGLVLTARGTDGDGNSIPMCGIPWHAADNYFGRLVRSGFSVALVVVIASALSCCFAFLPILRSVSSGFVIIICAVVAAVVGAIIKPIDEEEEVQV